MSVPSLLEQARWIGREVEHVPEFTPRSGPQDLPLALAECEGTLILRTVVEVPRAVRRASLRMTARGIYVARLGGTRVSDAQLTPTWTDYRHRYVVQEVDVTELLAPGQIVWSVELGTGWYAGFLGMDRGHQARQYGDHTAIRGELTMVDEHGGSRVVRTDESWFVGTSSSVHADMMQGQMIDPRRSPAGWADLATLPPGFEPVQIHPDDGAVLAPQTAPDIVVRERLRVVGSHRAPSGALVLDVGQNIVGRVRLPIPPAAPGHPVGSHVHLRHGEALDGDGEIYTENLRWASAHDIAVVTDDAWVFDPEMTFHGFRYIEITGYPGDLRPDDVEILVLGPHLEQVGTFACSEPDVMTLHENIVRTIRNNLVGAPTDCPQRDERLGWMGDLNVISSTAIFGLDLDRYLTSWLADVRSGQHANGAFPDVAPRVVVEVEGSPGWADAGVLVPWRLHRAHRSDATRAMLSDHYPAMAAFMEHLGRSNPDHYRERGLSRNYGDWLHLDDPTDKTDLATAYWALCADAMVGASTALSLGADTAHWRSTARAVRDAWWRRHADALTGSATPRSQTSLAMALMCRLVPDEWRQTIGDRLRDAVLSRGTALASGIHGTRFLLPALSQSGSLDLAYALLTRRDYPSWLYAVDRGATTIWERWDGWTEHAGFQTPFMNSLDHDALGSVGEWLHEYVAGLRPGEGGYATPHVRPHVGGGLRHAGAARWTDQGRSSCSWRIDGSTLVVDVDSPAGARVSMPTTDVAAIEAPAEAVAVADPWPTLLLPAGRHSVACAWDEGWSAPAARDADWV